MEGKVILLVVIGTIGVMLMAFSVVFFVLLYRRKTLENKLEMQELKTKHQEEMLHATLRSQEKERNRLGSELHDSVGAMLSSIKLNLQVAKRKNEVEVLDSVLGHLDETIGQVRSISHQMMPIILKKYGLKKAIEELFERISSDRMDAQISKWGELSLSKDNELMLYRVIQELTSNTLKHAEATSILMSIDISEDSVSIQFEDNGRGFPQDVLANSDGIGLLNIKNRAQSIGASVVFSNNEKGGAKVNLVIDQSID